MTYSEARWSWSAERDDVSQLVEKNDGGRWKRVDESRSEENEKNSL